VVVVRQKGLFGVVFILTGLFLFAVGWYDLKQKGTPAYGRTITIRTDDMPAWKRWVLYAGIVLFLLVCLWLIVGGILNGRTTGSL
jgi:hypothetical protein